MNPLSDFFVSIPQGAWAMMLFFLILGVLIGRLIWGRALARNEQIAFELAQARSNADQAGSGRAQLERDLASTRDQVRPLADEVERLRRENAKLQTAAAAAPAAVRVTESASVPREDLTDLRLLKGVGDKMIARLRELRIEDNRDLASLNPDEASRVDSGLGPFEGRIARDQLIEQARLLVDGRVAEFEARYGRLERA